MVITRARFRIGFLTLLLAGFAFLWINWGLDAYYRWRQQGLIAQVGHATQPSERSVERGQYLARVGNCLLCHSTPGAPPMAGGRAIQTPFGAVFASNLTPDPVAGLGRWTRDDFWQALHLGLRPDGARLNPAFPYTSFSRITRSDADALWDYLQTLPASDQRTPAAQIAWPFGTQTALAFWRALYFKPFDAPSEAAGHELSPNDLVAWTRGRYLVEGLGHCQECHSPRDRLGGIHAGSRGDGGVLPGVPWYAPALRSGAQDQIASVDELAAFLQSGQAGNRFAAGPMAEVVLHGTQFLTDADAGAMAQYLQSLPPGPASSGLTKFAQLETTTGADIYQDRCAQCHGDQGQGRANAYPALAGNRSLLADQPNNAVLSVLHGGFSPSTSRNRQPFGMPPYLLELSDAQVALVLNFTRNSWGNQGQAISALQVQQLRQVQGKR